MEFHIEENQVVVVGRWLKVLTVAVCAVFVCAQVWAASALAYDDINGTPGYGIGTDKATAKAAALQNCTDNGATVPKFWFWYQNKGWGAMAHSDNGGGNWFIGGALGYGTKKKAKRKAKRECKNGGGTDCQVYFSFKDTIGKSEKGAGISFHLGSN